MFSQNYQYKLCQDNLENIKKFKPLLKNRAVLAHQFSKACLYLYQMNPDSNFFAHINLSFKPNHITRGFCFFFLYYQHILRTEVLMSSDSCTTHTPLVTKSHGTGCAGNPFYTSSRRATGEHLLQSLLPLCLCSQPQGQGQPSYCYGKHTGDWINFLAIRVWKLRQCQEEAGKS